jgi:hypothetical protein
MPNRGPIGGRAPSLGEIYANLDGGGAKRTADAPCAAPLAADDADISAPCQREMAYGSKVNTSPMIPALLSAVLSGPSGLFTR